MVSHCFVDVEVGREWLHCVLPVAVLQAVVFGVVGVAVDQITRELHKIDVSVSGKSHYLTHNVNICAIETPLTATKSRAGIGDIHERELTVAPFNRGSFELVLIRCPRDLHGVFIICFRLEVRKVEFVFLPFLEFVLIFTHGHLWLTLIICDERDHR